MNQTSDKFFDEMLKDNAQKQPQGSFQEQLADMIDKRISETMKKFEDQFNQIKQPQTDPAEAAAVAQEAVEADQILRPEETQALSGVDSTIENK